MKVFKIDLSRAATKIEKVSHLGLIFTSLNGLCRQYFENSKCGLD